MITISLCMIVKNEEQTLANCLESVRGIADEINIVDTGSRDRTKELARRYTDRIYTYEWREDFAAARNYSFSHASGTYILWLDADDEVSEEDRKRLLRLKEELHDSVKGVVMPYSYLDGAAGQRAVTGRRLRLVRREQGCRWVGRIHEYLEFPEDGIILSDAVIRHTRKAGRSNRNLRILRRWIAEEPGVTDRRLFFYANECYERHQYKLASAGYGKLLGESAGYREDRLIACSRLADCYRRLGEPRLALNSLLYSLHYGPPQADYCCQIGEWFEEREDWRTAVYWHAQAAAARSLDTGLRPVPPAALTWLPHIRLALCYVRLGELVLAYKHNEQALAYLPHDPGLLGNKSKLEAAMQLRSN
jgi:glycosyltransferase involved in cell wall biosynthesis